MKNNWLKIGVAVAAVMGLTGLAQADQINGDITFTGGAQLNTGSSGTATGVIGWQDTTVESSDGDLASVAPGTAVTFKSPWFFVSGPVVGLWSVGGYTFDLNFSTIQFQGGSPASVSVTGQGTLSGNGFDATTFSWAFTTQDPGAGNPLVFSFSAAAGSVAGSVPDGGTTVMLLGSSLLGLGLLKRKLLFA